MLLPPLARAYARLAFGLSLVLAFSLALSTVSAQSPLQETLRGVAPVEKGALTLSSSATDLAEAPWAAVLDPALRPLAAAEEARRTTGRYPAAWQPEAFTQNLAATVQADGQVLLDLLVEARAPAALGAVPGVEVRTVVGNVAVVRAPSGALVPLARRDGVRFVEAARLRSTLNDAGRADIRADIVHQGGGGLPQAYRGRGVVVGVLDSGIDVTHPDFFDAGGTRLRSLLEFTQGGGQVEWTKAQIDANPSGVTQQDGDGGQGHGTHVMGTAAGNGGFSANQTGIAPESDLVFVKGIRSPTSTGGFSDADVIAGVDYMFRAAGSQPAVVNLSLGGNFGPLDGTSLYEQSLSGLTGEGRVIVAAAGNSGFQLIHAGDQTQANVLNETLLFANDPSIALASMWYDSGTLTEFYIGAYTLDAFGELVYLGEVGVNAGQVLDGGNGQPLPFVVDGVTLGSVVIDAQTTQDPRNGDGNVIFGIFGDPQNGIDVSQTIWTILSVGPSGGRMDMWALSGSEFFGGVVGFPSINEMPGNTMMTMGSPSTARDVIAVGSYVTRNRWVDIDGVARDWLNPSPDRDPNSPPVIPAIGQRSYFSSLGPTRDGRVTPDIAAPGELIFSSMSSALNVGVGVQRHEILQGGGYKSLQGTSMASPHVAGTIALMLEVDPTLTPAEAREIIQATARSDGFTGSVPNNGVGAGKLDALAAVQETIRRNGGSGGGGTSVAEAEPNNTIPTAQPLGGSTPITVAGFIESSDNGDVTVNYQGGVVDDFEDLFRVSTTTTGLTLTLSDYTQDLDLVLLEEDNGGLAIVDLSASVDATESISAPALAPGTYYVGVSFYDGEGQSGTSPYRLVVDGGSPVDAEDEATVASLALHSTYPNPVSASTTIGFELPEAAPVKLVVYDMLGREVATVLDGPMSAGSHATPFDASRLASGVYVYRLRAGDETRTRSFVVTR